MYSKFEQLKKRKEPKAKRVNKNKPTVHEKEYLNWLQSHEVNCFACGEKNGVEWHHLTDIKRIKGKRRVHTRLIPLCGIKCHRLGENAIHVLSKEEYYKKVKSLEELLQEAERIYNEFKSTK